MRSLNRKNRILGIDEPPPVCYNHTCAKRRGALPRFTISGTGPKTALPRRFGNKMEVYTMSTTLAKPAEMADRKWYVIDAAGKPLGRVAAKAAVLLRGKDKVTFTPNVDCGDHVIIINCDEAVLTGKKLEKKFHRTHSLYIGGLKETQYKKLMAENSDKAMTYAVKGMIPSNTIGAKALTRLHCYKTAEHKHDAQKPEAVEL